VYEIIKSLKPYFFSLREIKENVSLDLKIPVSWKYEKIAQVYKTLQLKIQDKNDKDVLISFICTATREGYDIVFQCANEVVEKNIEEEKKRELFDKKVRDLREVFEKLGLDELEKLKFEQDVKDHESEGLRLVGEGNEEGSDGDREPQESDDPTTEDDEERGFFPITKKRK
jgi:hypothetical protein